MDKAANLVLQRSFYKLIIRPSIYFLWRLDMAQKRSLLSLVGAGNAGNTAALRNCLHPQVCPQPGYPRP